MKHMRGVAEQLERKTAAVSVMIKRADVKHVKGESCRKT